MVTDQQKNQHNTHLLLVHNVDASLDVREGMRRRQSGFALVLIVQVTVGSAVQGEGRTVHEGTQVVVLVKVGDSFLQLVCVKVRLDVGDLEVGLKQMQTCQYVVMPVERFVQLNCY